MRKKHYKEAGIKIIYSCIGSINFIRDHKDSASKVLFYGYDDKLGVWILIENIDQYKETEFSSQKELIDYVEEKYN